MIAGVDRGAVIAEEQRIMDMYAPHYRTNTLTNSYPYQCERRRFVDWIVSIVREGGADLASASALDVGCGTGEILELLWERGCKRLTGLDISPEMINEARRHLPDATFHRQSVDEFASEPRFDLIVAAFAVHHLHDPRIFFELVDRCLLPGGWFFVLDYNTASWSHRRPLSTVLTAPLIPLRVALKIKNRRQLAQLDHIPALFNPGHLQLSCAELYSAVPNPDFYRLRCVTHGLWLPGLKHALWGDAQIDRALMRALETIERAILPTQAGHFQWVAGQRTSSSQRENSPSAQARAEASN